MKTTASSVCLATCSVLGTALHSTQKPTHCAPTRPPFSARLPALKPSAQRAESRGGEAFQRAPPLPPALPATEGPKRRIPTRPWRQPALLRPGFPCGPGWFLSLATQEPCLKGDHDRLLGFTLCARLANTAVLEDLGDTESLWSSSYPRGSHAAGDRAAGRARGAPKLAFLPRLLLTLRVNHPLLLHPSRTFHII